jgi:hypothetical protein
MNGKIVVSMSQNTMLIHLLETDDASNDEALIEQMMNDAKVDRETANSYLRSWRFNHQEGAIAAIRSAVHAINPTITTAKAEQASRRLLGANGDGHAKLFLDDGEKGPGKDPADGSGKVAQIIALHKEGKSNREIIEMGYNKSTVNRQVSEYKKRVAESKSQTTL